MQHTLQPTAAQLNWPWPMRTIFHLFKGVHDLGCQRGQKTCTLKQQVVLVILVTRRFCRALGRILQSAAMALVRHKDALFLYCRGSQP